MARRDLDPFPAYNFLVEIDNIEIARFSEISGLTVETEVIEYREGSEKRNSVRKLPGITRFGNVVLKRGLATSNELWLWKKQIINGEIERRDVVVIQLDENREQTLRWQLSNCWPARYEGPVLNASKSEIAIESLTLATEDIDALFP